MVRTERVTGLEQSNLKKPRNQNAKKQYTRQELDELVVRLAEVHGLV